MDGRYDVGDVVLNDWKLMKLLGEGSYGRVFEAERDDFGAKYRAAIKIITIPQSQSEITNAQSEGMDEDSVTTYFRSFVEDIVQEFVLMSKLKGTANVVSYEDHQVIPHKDGIGWDIFIRMELLKPLPNYIMKQTLSANDVMKLGIDICKALELCKKYNIVHRDIKPENIFISEMGDYKLGDFGIARTIEKTLGGLSKKGTYTYMAPEVYKGEAYNASVDIYSLGIVMYRLLNNQRTPFLPVDTKYITPGDRENALLKCMSGEPMPAPQNADEQLAKIVLKACAYKPKDRYANATEMKEELECLLYGWATPPVSNTVSDEILEENGNEEVKDLTQRIFKPHPDNIGQKSMAENKTDKADKIVTPVYDIDSTPNKKSKRPLLITLLSVIILAIGLCSFLFFHQANLDSNNQVDYASNNQVDFDSNNHTVSSWSGFVHAYSSASLGKGIDSNDIFKYGDIFKISDYTNENEVTEIATSSKQLSKRGYYLQYPTIIVKDNIPETFELDKEYTFKFKLKAPVVPSYVSYHIGKDDGLAEEGDWEYNNGYCEIPYTFNWTSDSSRYSAGDEIKIQIIVHYTDSDYYKEDPAYENHYIDCTVDSNNHTINLDSNKHTVSSWGGFAHVYSADSKGLIYGGEGVNSNDVNTYGDVFRINDYTNENEVTEIVTSSKQLSERGYYLQYPTIIVEDNIPKAFELDKEYIFKFKLKAPVVPNYVSYHIGKGGGILEEGEVEYNNGYVEIPYTFNWIFESTNYSFGDEVKIQIVIHYEDIDDNGDYTYEEHYIESL